MKVAFYSYHAFEVVHSASTSAGGMELQVLLLGRELTKRGIGVEFLVGDFGQPDVVEEDGLVFRKIFRATTSSNASKLLFFLRTLRSSRADIVLERGSSVSSGILYAASRIVGMKYIFAAASDVNCDRRSHDPSIQGRFRRRLYDLAIRGADAVVVQKRSQQMLLRRSYGRDGVVIRSLALVPEGLSADGKAHGRAIVWISNLHRYKQPELFLELARRMPNHRFIMAGGTKDQAFSQELTDAARRIPNLDFRGFIPQREVWGLLSEARVIVNTTVVDGKYEEGFPNTFIQAWALGVPVVSLISDPDSIVTELNVGRVSRTIDGMERDISDLCASDDEWNEISSRCRKLFAGEFVADNIVGAYLNLLQNCSGVA